MPRQASQCRSWEKDRRDRFKKELEELTKILPSYDPSVTISKIEILKQAHTTIIELREEIKGLTTSTQETTTFKDEQIKKLQERIKKLLVRNEQLTKLFKEAGIKPPKFFFRRPGIFSNRTTPEQAKILQQKEMEKENVLSGSSRAKPKRRKPKQTKVSKTINIANRVKKLNKLRKTCLASNGLLLLSHIPTVPAINQQLVFVPNAPLQNVSRGSGILTIPCTQPVTSKPTAGLTPVNLKSGTMILGNANIISVLPQPQPQIMIPPLTLPSQTVMFSKGVKKTKANGAVANSTADMKKNLRIHPRSCVTSTTQINKVPIPALTSKYANTSVLLHYSDNCSKKEKQPNKICTNRKVKIPKRKIIDKNEPEVKKKKSENLNNESDKNCATDEISKEQKFDAIENTENITSNGIENSPELVESGAKSPPGMISESSKAVETPDTVQNKVNEDKMQSVQEVPVPVDSAKSDKDNSAVISENSDMTASFTTTSASYTSTDTLTVSAGDQEDAIKNIDLNLVHSDLSNDIFASLQVPPGCQNTESTSPTAAFLLAFPLVSSIKVTEVIDEENSDSQRETPTLLQIGSMDPKASHNDALLNLDNFPFFNHNYYNSKIETNSGNVNLDKRTLDGKLENESFNIFAETNGQGASYEMESKKKLDNQQNQRNVVNDEQFLLYEDKTETENVKLKNFQENSHNKQDPTRKNYNQLDTEKLQTSCNTYTNYGMCQDNLLPPSISTSYNLSDNLLYKNYNEKTAQPSVGKQLFSNENIFKPTDKLFSNDQKDFNTPKDPKINQNPVNCNNKNAYHPYNFFELPRTSKETTFNPTESCSNKESPTKAAEICPKLKETKTSCFSSNYSSTNVSSTKTAPCTYATPKKSNPFYTNCNYSYNYSDQSYYKPDAKPAYSLSYENYQEYRKTDTFFCNNANRKSEKLVNQNKTVNWMTEQKSQPSDCFLPTFTNQSYSFTSCISTDTSDVNKKTSDLADKRFSWSPTKLPNFLEPAHNFITPTLPTLVGDLALGNSLPINETKIDYKYTKEPKKKMFDSTNQANFLSVSQLVNQSKTEINSVPGRTAARRQSGNAGNKPKTNVMKSKRPDKSLVKSVNNFDMFYEQKNKNPNKNVISNYSAESLIGNPQNTQETKKCAENSAKPICSSNFFADNIVPYFSTMEDGYINQDHNSHNTYNTHNSFQNNNFPSNSFMYSTPPINSGYLEGSHEYSSQNVMNYCGIKYNKNFNNNNSNKNPRGNTKEDKPSYPSNVRKGKKIAQGNFDYSLLPVQGSTNSSVLTDDFQSHTFLPPAAPFACKNSLNQKQGNEFNSGPLLPLPGISKNHIQHPGVSPSLNNAGTSLTNFNLSTIFPEINKGTTPNLHNNSNKSKTNSIYLESPFNADSKYGFLG